METFSASLAICAGNSPVSGEFPAQRPVTWSFDVFFDLCPSKWLSKQSRGWWFETPFLSLWSHCNGYITGHPLVQTQNHPFVHTSISVIMDECFRLEEINNSPFFNRISFGDISQYIFHEPFATHPSHCADIAFTHRFLHKKDIILQKTFTNAFFW